MTAPCGTGSPPPEASARERRPVPRWMLGPILAAAVGWAAALAWLVQILMAPHEPPARTVAAEAVKVVVMDDPSLGLRSGGLKAELVATKTRFMLGESVPLTLKITNASQKDIVLLEHQDKVYRYTMNTRFVIRMPNGVSAVLRDAPGYAMREASFPARITLPPGETYSWDMVLNEWLAPWNTFGSLGLPPGIYLVYAEYCLKPAGFPEEKPLWSGTLRSNAVAFEVAKDAVPQEGEKVFWGQAAEGLRCGATVDKVIWGPGETPAGSIVVRNMGTAGATDGAIVIGSFAIVESGGGSAYVPLTAQPNAITNPQGIRVAKGEEFRYRFDLSGLLRSYPTRSPVTLRFVVIVYTSDDLVTAGPWTKGLSSGSIRILILDDKREGAAAH